MNIQVHMLTGDSHKTAASVATELGIKHVLSGVLPQEKEDYIRKLQEEGVLLPWWATASTTPRRLPVPT